MNLVKSLWDFHWDRKETWILGILQNRFDPIDLYRKNRNIFFVFGKEIRIPNSGNMARNSSKDIKPDLSVSYLSKINFGSSEASKILFECIFLFVLDNEFVCVFECDCTFVSDVLLWIESLL